MMLEQTSSFRPFMGQTIPLFVITGWTRQHQIAHVVCRDASADSATHGIGMLDMKDILPIPFFKLRITTSRVVTSILLPFQLFLDLCRGMRTCDGSFLSTIPLRIYSHFEKIIFSPIRGLFRMRESIPFCICQYFVAMQYAVATFICHPLLIMCSTIAFPSFSRFFWICLAISLCFFPLLFSVLRGIMTPSHTTTLYTFGPDTREAICAQREVLSGSRIDVFALGAPFASVRNNVFRFCCSRTTRLATRGQSAFLYVVSMEVFGSRGKPLFAFGTLFHSLRFWRCRFGGRSAYFALAVMPIWASFISVEICKRFELLAPRTHFLRSGNGIGIHTRNCLSFPALSSCCQGGKATASSHRIATPILGNNFIIILFLLTQQKTERGVTYGT